LTVKRSEALKEGLRFLHGKMKDGVYSDNNGIEEEVD
jgi:hypothetical protein